MIEGHKCPGKKLSRLRRMGDARQGVVMKVVWLGLSDYAKNLAHTRYLVKVGMHIYG